MRRVIRVLSILLTWTLVSTLGLIVFPERAQACQCFGTSVSALDLADGLFIGVGTGIERTGDYGVTYTFDVEQSIFGDHGDSVQLERNIGGCEFSGDPAYPRAIAYHRRDGRLTGNFCDSLDAHAARLQLVPPAVDPDAGPAQWMIHPRRAVPYAWLLDAQGRIAGFLDDAGVNESPTGLRLPSVADCSSHGSLIEWRPETLGLVIRNLTNLNVTHTFEHPRNFDAVECYGPRPSDVWIGADGTGFSPADGPGGAGSAWLFQPASGAEIDLTVSRSSSTPIVFHPFQRSAFIVGSGEIYRVDLRTTERESLVNFESLIGPTSVVGGDMSISDDGSTLAVNLSAELNDGSYTSRVLIVDLASGRVRAFVSEGRYGAPIWFGNNRFVLVGQPAIAVDVSTGEMNDLPVDLDHRWRADRGLDSTLLGLPPGNRLLQVNPFSGERTMLGEFPANSLSRTERLTTAVHISAGQPVATPDRYCLGMVVTVDLGAGELPTAGNDVILGTDDADVIAAGEGDDVICAGAGDDQVWGQAGDDLIYGGDGDDRLRGGDGNDNVHGEAGQDNLAGGRGDDVVLGGSGDDPLIRGNTGNDVLNGGAGDDQLVSGNGGEDIVRGGAGDDFLLGGPRPDVLEGGRGNDVLRGLGGADVLRGGDVFSDFYNTYGADSLFGSDGNDILDAGSEGICNGGPGTDTATTCGTQIGIEVTTAPR